MSRGRYKRGFADGGWATLWVEEVGCKTYSLFGETNETGPFETKYCWRSLNDAMRALVWLTQDTDTWKSIADPIEEEALTT